MTGIILMVVGGLLWLTGELIGVFSKRPNDTTSEGVWWLEKQRYYGMGVRALVLAFTVSLVGHFQFGWSLLP